MTIRSRIRSEKKVVRQEVVWLDFPVTKTFPTGEEKPFRIWTLFVDGDKDKKPELPIVPVHNQNAFLEDFVHDWNVQFDRESQRRSIRYYSRVVDRPVWILIEYAVDVQPEVKK